MKVAIVHDWLVNYGGAESWVEHVLHLYPDADIYTLVYDKKKMAGHFEHNKIYTSSLQKLPFATKIYTKLLKFMPRAFESFDFSGYDLVICSSSSCAKGVITPPSVPQIAYIHSPMRYAWDLFFDYRRRSGKLTRFFMDRWMGNIRLWDYVSSQRIDTIVANSHYIARRIKKFWNRDAQVVFCPISLEKFYPAEKDVHENFYVAFSRLVPYKRIDLAISAVKGTGRKLVVIGGGSEAENLHQLAKGDPNITFTGRIGDDELRSYLQRCRALIFCAEEDFGLVPIEAQACGRPVIAFGKGGACETVISGRTGVFFDNQDTTSVRNAIETFEELDERHTFNSAITAAHAQEFSAERFYKEFQKAVDETVKKVHATAK